MFLSKLALPLLLRKALFNSCIMLVSQSCQTLRDPMDCSLPCSSIHGILQARILEWVAVPFSRRSSQGRDQIQISMQESNPDLPHCGQILYQLSHKGSPKILEWVAYPFFSRSSLPRNRTKVSCIAGRFFTS